MKRIYSDIQSLDPVKKDYEVDALFGYGDLSAPTIAFCDEPLTIFSEQWNAKKGWDGWLEEVLDPREYFKRRLKGK